MLCRALWTGRTAVRFKIFFSFAFLLLSSLMCALYLTFSCALHVSCVRYVQAEVRSI